MKKGNYIVEDLRGIKNAPADFKIHYQSGFALLVKITTSDIVSICGYENGKSVIDLVIPKEVLNYRIVRIDISAFASCSHLLTVVIPDSVKYIEENAFNSCPLLTAVSIPKSVKKIGVNAFGLCKSLREIIIDDFSLLKGTGYSEKAWIISMNKALIMKLDFNHQYLTNLAHGKDIMPLFLLAHNTITPFISLDKLQILELYSQDEDALNNPDFISVAHNIVFRPIINYFSDNISIGNSIDYSNSVFSNSFTFTDNKDILFFIGGHFVKYLHIYNHAPNGTGFVNVYFDYSQKIITNDINEIDNNNIIFKDDSLTKLTDNVTGVIGGDVIECCTTLPERKTVLNPHYYPAVYFDSNQYQFSDFLHNWVKPSDNNLEETKPLLLSIDSFIKKDNSVTNVFYIGNHGQKLDSLYSLWANVGIDCTHVKNINCVKSFLEQLQKFLHRISVQIQVNLTQQELHKKAVRSAIGQVSNRNFSHNFGAHVFSKLIGIDTYDKILDIASVDTYKPCYEQSEIKSKEQLAYFLRYVKNRMDYLSELTFGVSNMMVSKNIYGDVIKDLDQTRLLLNYISGVSSFKYSFRLLYNGKELNNENDIVVAFPSDVLGCQAFYNIIENIIRNTAKHASKNRDAQELETFTINFSDNDDYPEYYCVDIDNGIRTEHNIDDLVDERNRCINETILDRNKDLRTSGLGTIEIKASTAFLRQIDIAKIDPKRFMRPCEKKDIEYNPPLLKAILINGSLGYRFYLWKSKEFLFVGDNWGVDSPTTQKLLNCGIQIVDSAKFVEKINKGESFVHQFLLYNDSISNNAVELLSSNNDSKTLLPLRQLKIDKEHSCLVASILKGSNINSIIEQLKNLVWNIYYQIILKAVHTKRINCGLELDEHVQFLSHAKQENFVQALNKSKTCKYEKLVENLSSQSMSKLPGFYRLSKGKREPLTDYERNFDKDNCNWIKQSLYTAYHERIVVIDERIQSHSKDYEGTIPVGELYKSTNVILPDISLEPKEFDDTAIKNIESFINNNSSNSILLIHYGVLERMYKDIPVISDRLSEWSKKVKRLVVTSGRGSHSLSLPDSVCFVDFSSVLYAFIVNRNKYIIDSLLHQTRRNK